MIGDILSWLRDNPTIGLLALLFLISILYVNSYTKAANAGKIIELNNLANQYKNEADDLRAFKAEIDVEVKHKDIKIAEYEKSYQALTAEIESNRQENQDLVHQLAEARQSVRHIDGTHALAESLKSAFPQFASAAGVGVTEFYDPIEQVYMPYMAIPLRFTQTFVIMKQEIESMNEQITNYQDNEQLCDDRDSLQQRIVSLERDKFDLQRRLSEQCTVSYELGLGRFDEVRKDLQQCLSKPRVDLGGWFSFGAGALLSGAACGYMR